MPYDTTTHMSYSIRGPQFNNLRSLQTCAPAPDLGLATQEPPPKIEKTNPWSTWTKPGNHCILHIYSGAILRRWRFALRVQIDIEMRCETETLYLLCLLKPWQHLNFPCTHIYVAVLHSSMFHTYMCLLHANG